MKLTFQAQARGSAILELVARSGRLFALSGILFFVSCAAYGPPRVAGEKIYANVEFASRESGR